MNRKMKRTGRRRTYRRKRNRRRSGRSGRTRRLKFRNTNLQSKLVVFRDKFRVEVQGNPNSVDGVSIANSGNFNGISSAEYSRGVRECRGFNRIAFSGFSVSVKKTAECETQYTVNPTVAVSAIAVNKTRSTGRLSFVTDLYVDTTQMAANDVFTETVLGVKKNIGFKGRKVYTYKVSKHLHAGQSIKVKDAFLTSTPPNIPWPLLLNFQSDTTLTKQTVPGGFFLVCDTWPTAPLAPATIINTFPWHTTSCQVHINYYFKVWGKQATMLPLAWG
ncbi:putative capsid protein [McMurdo Ice Shelf pond-associated circular DNA virus-2]|uniref:putative capsid protein n=1 Tax=McMurdo Ice Shelf pond-associated circular DNA virus-2 TaxID=1521386 RepID=UPI0004D1CC7F|nr:putative capsid protein [McMurdo Ice Shelf pond-associated circular DNA virus-2]AIF71503.1 putative capsid protein [McMurdo Ice Shelf pond-associated circular DNA virus-2]